MTITQSAIIAIVGWFILMFVGTNLVGMVVRGFFTNRDLEKQKNEVHPALKGEFSKTARVSFIISIVFAFVGLFLLYLLYWYTNIGVVIAAVLIMFARVPDLLWQIRQGQDRTTYNLPKGGIYTVTTLVPWVALILLWLALYRNG